MSSNNLAFFFQNFTTSFISGQGSIDYTTAGVVPSNSIGNRVFVLTLQGTLIPNASNTYQLQLDFSKVQSSLNIDLEGPLNGQFNMKEKTENAQKYVTYDATNIRSTRQLYVTIRPPCIKKPKSFYLNIQINDASSACPSPTNQPLVYYSSQTTTYTSTSGSTTYKVRLNNVIGPTILAKTTDCTIQNQISPQSCSSGVILVYLDIFNPNGGPPLVAEWVTLCLPSCSSSITTTQYEFSSLVSVTFLSGGIQVSLNPTNNSVVISLYGGTAPPSSDFTSTPSVVLQNYGGNGPIISNNPTPTITQSTSSGNSYISKYQVSFTATYNGKTYQANNINVPLPLTLNSESSALGTSYIPYEYVGIQVPGCFQILTEVVYGSSNQNQVVISNFPTNYWRPGPLVTIGSPSSLNGVSLNLSGSCTQLSSNIQTGQGYSYIIYLTYNGASYQYTYYPLQGQTGSTPTTFIPFSNFGIPSSVTGYVQVCYTFSSNTLTLSLTSSNSGTCTILS